MRTVEKIVVDADALIALVNEDDANHDLAINISGILTKQNTKLLVPVTTVIEAITALKRVIERPDLTKVIIDQCVSGLIPVVDVPADILPLAESFFDPKSSKQDTFFDAVIAAFAKKHNADAIFSFDKGYKKNGIPLIAELLEI